MLNMQQVHYLVVGHIENEGSIVWWYLKIKWLCLGQLNGIFYDCSVCLDEFGISYY